MINHFDRIQKYAEKFEIEFQNIWARHKCKWFFSKYRKNKIRKKLFYRKRLELYNLLDETIQDVLPEMMKTHIENFAFIHDIK